MIELWVPVTLTAALLQCVRTALQQRLKGILSVNGAGFVRYLYGTPISLALLAGIAMSPAGVPPMTGFFLLCCLIAGVGQIGATSLLIYSFRLRNFAVGTAYSKTETMQAAILSVVLLSETLGLGAWLGIVISLGGVLILSLGGDRAGLRAILFGWTEKAALVGMGAGTLFAITSIAIRAGTFELGEADAFSRAFTTLAITNSMQTVLLGGYLAWREPLQLRLVVQHWRSSCWVGILSVCGSMMWFLGMTLTDVASVRALGQIELIFTFIASRFFLDERPRLPEIVGSILVVTGVVFVLLGR